MRPKKQDRRVERTRRDLLNAFRDLVLERGFDGVTVRDIIKYANVGRSTFYEHFENKDDLLKQSLKPLFSVLADTIDARRGVEHLRLIIEHFWDNRRLTRVMLAGSTRNLMSLLLSELIEEKLVVLSRNTRGAKRLIPLPLLAAHLAGGQLALIESWLSGDAACTSEVLARALYLSTSSSVLLKRA